MKISTLVHPLRRSRLKPMALALIALTFMVTPARALASGRLVFISSPSSSIGSGESVTAGPENGFNVYAYTYPVNSLPWYYSYPYGGLSPIWFSINDYSTNPDTLAARSWSLKFEAPWLQRLQIGSYSGASRFGDVGIPGLDFSRHGRTNSNPKGSFEILDASYNEDDGTVLAFAANFLQYDNSNLNNWVKGAIRYNSDLPSSLVPEPYTPSTDDLPPDPTDQSSGIGAVVTDPPEEGGAEENPNGVEPSAGWFSSGSSSSSSSSFPGTTLEAIYFPVSGTPVPGPLPAAAAVGGWRWSRRLRRRCQPATDRQTDRQGSSQPRASGLQAGARRG